MLRIIVLFCFSVFIFSCSKDAVVPSTVVVQQSHIPNAEDYYPLTKGSYWVYDYYEIFMSTGAEKFSYRDSVYIYGDTIIDGHTYAYQKHSFQNGWTYMRDSSGCMVLYRADKILFSCNNYTDTFEVNQDFPYTIYQKMIHRDTLISTSMGNFHSISKGYIWYYLKDPMPKNEYLFFAKGVGMIQYCHWYYPNCFYKLEGRLVKYHVN